MADYLKDDEHVEALKRWWDENGKSTMAAIVLAVAGTVGWQQYQGWSVEQAEQASDLWAAMETQLTVETGRDVAAARDVGETLKADYQGSIYARFAALQLAALDVKVGDLEGAESELRWALGKEGSTSELGQLIQLRLARVLADRGEESAALAILDVGSGAYPVAYATARGDIHLSAGRDQEALDAYLEARAVLLALGNPPGILDTKITSLESRLATGQLSPEEGAS